MVFSAGHVCSSNLGYHSRGQREVTRTLERHNDEMRQNRGMLRTLSEADLYLSRQKLPFRGHDESSNSLNRGNYGEILESFARHLHGKAAGSERANVGVLLVFQVTRRMI